MAILKNGHATTIVLTVDADMSFEVRSIQAPGLEVAEIDVTTMSHTKYKESVAGSLVKVGDATLEVVYDTAILTELIAVIGDGNNNSFVITWPDASTWTWWGFIKSFTPGPVTSDAQPTATMVLSASNQSNVPAETAPAVG